MCEGTVCCDEYLVASHSGILPAVPLYVCGEHARQVFQSLVAHLQACEVLAAFPEFRETA
jgi:hypothetical protein